MANVIFIDNQDSFTYNLVDELSKLNHNVTVYRNTVSAAFLEEKISQAALDDAVILFFSPGPGKPSDVPLMENMLSSFKGKLPIIGVCLGHQAIAEYYGATIGLAGETVHGKANNIKVNNHPIFDGFNDLLTVARYHSLAAFDLPRELTVIGHFNDIPMAVIDEQNKVLGFQFHPESILTTHGAQLLKQSIEHLIK